MTLNWIHGGDITADQIKGIIMNFNELVNELVLAGVEVTLKLRDGQVVGDLNFNAKSEGVLAERGGLLVVVGRYTERVVESVQDCAEVFVDFQCGREYGSQNWVSLAASLGVSAD